MPNKNNRPQFGFAFAAGHKVGDPRAKQKIGAQHARQLIEMAEVTGKTFYLWWAYKECRAHGSTLPVAILKYLDRVAENLFAAAATTGSLDRAISAATEIRKSPRQKRGDVFPSNSDARDRTLSTASYSMSGEPLKVEAVASQYGVTPGTVSKARNKYPRTRK